MEPASKKHASTDGPPSPERVGEGESPREDEIPRPGEDEIPRPGEPGNTKKVRERKRYESKKNLVEEGYTVIDSHKRSLQLHAAKLLLKHYQHFSCHQPGTEISGGKTKQIPVTSSNDTLEEATLQEAIDMLLEAAQPTTSHYFNRRGAPPTKLRATSPSFALTKDDILGQIPHADSPSTAFLICLVYLTDGARGTEVWPGQNFEDLPRGTKIPDERELLRKAYGGAVAMTSEALLSEMVPVKEKVAFGDMLLLSPAKLHRGPPSVDERLCFFFAIEPEGLQKGYNNEAQNTIDDLAMRCHGFNSDEFMACHDTWLRRGFGINYDGNVGAHVDEGYRRWQEWTKKGKKGVCKFFPKAARDAVSGAYATCFD